MIFLEIVLLALVVGFIGYPIFRPESALTNVADDLDELPKLLYRKDASLQAIKDLEFDYGTGKIDEDDYRELKRSFESEAVDILRKIETAEKGGSPRKGDTKKANGVNFCASCGGKVTESDNFCPRCGKSVRRG